MRMREFIRENRDGIDQVINRLRGGPEGTFLRQNDQERKEWVLSDEPLYRWAQCEGVPV